MGKKGESSTGSTPETSSEKKSASDTEVEFKKPEGVFSAGIWKKKEKDDKVSRDAIGTIYLSANVSCPHGYDRPMEAMDHCLKSMIMDLKLEYQDVDDNMSVASESSRAMSSVRLPKVIVPLVESFVTLILSPANASVGLISFCTHDTNSVTFVYHYSRCYIRNQKSITLNGMREKRCVMTKSRERPVNGMDYSVTLTIICT